MTQPERGKARVLIERVYDRYPTAYRGEEERLAFEFAIATAISEARAEVWKSAIQIATVYHYSKSIPAFCEQQGVTETPHGILVAALEIAANEGVK